MRRRTILILATGLAILAAILPLVACGYISRERAIAAEQAHLSDYARWALKRSSQTLADGMEVLRFAAAARPRDCSPAHIARLRQLVLESQVVEEIGFYRGDRLECTSWAVVGKAMTPSQPDQWLAGGHRLYVGIKPEILGGDPMLVLSNGSDDALINPRRMVDVLTDGKLTVGVATAKGDLIALNGKADAALVHRLSRQIVTGLDDRHIFASARGPGLIAFAISDRALVQAKINRELELLIPVGLFVSAVLVGVIVWVSRQRLSPRRELEIAVARREFFFQYQPIIDLAKGRCIGAEALIRWKRPDGSWVSPDLFIPLAEQSGLITAITNQLIERVVGDLAPMLIDEPDAHIAINLSAQDMEDGGFLPVLEAALVRSGVAPPQIWLEATERGFLHADTARRTIEAARARGHVVAIDDFGTGYSSLSLLEGLPLDTLKIDKSFIDAIGRDAATSVVTPHIIDMAHGLNFKIVAEGVETIEQEAYIRKAGVQFAQGWFYSKALPPEDFTAFYHAYNARRPKLMAVA
ncbi:EAL domain-containing protein [Sphingomonas naphthae]|uniref:cyclic-guanylate-specific phosphodiesterase n=1 Tax=Sphingomonas naphthae TaxID=1813468 RepID=A0ABY7TIK4_9SPHN|nr:EAL domain-containing protein [Sphingomonas naphthae]WCT73042.1 EAL domain-containing protein [Sphingomonas naphthae]